jgi:hypothetical protein
MAKKQKKRKKKNKKRKKKKNNLFKNQLLSLYKKIHSVKKLLI